MLNDRFQGSPLAELRGTSNETTSPIYSRDRDTPDHSRKMTETSTSSTSIEYNPIDDLLSLPDGGSHVANIPNEPNAPMNMSNNAANDSENPFGVSGAGLQLINNLVGSMSNNSPHKLPPNEAYKKFNEDFPPIPPDSSNKDVASISLQGTNTSSHEYTFGSSTDSTDDNRIDPEISTNSNGTRKRPYRKLEKQLMQKAKDLYDDDLKRSKNELIQLLIEEVEYWRRSNSVSRSPFN